jgi:hypothetical protein
VFAAMSLPVDTVKARRPVDDVDRLAVMVVLVVESVDLER